MSSKFSVFAGDAVAKKKPAPDIYQLAISKGEFDVSRTIAIEDSGIGCRSAISAGLGCLVKISTFTAYDDVNGAALVGSCLGELGKVAAKVVNNNAKIHLKDSVKTETMEQLSKSNLKN